MPHCTNPKLRLAVRLAVVVWCLWTVLGVKPASAAEPPSDYRVAQLLFGEEHLESNALAVSEAARRLPPDTRFDYLADWVLPSPVRPTIRLSGRFFYPLTTLPLSQPEDQPRRSIIQQKLLPGMTLVCPAVELIEAASITGRLDELSETLAETTVDYPRQKYYLATLRFLTDVTREAREAATTAFDQVIATAYAVDRASFESRWPAVLMLRASLPDAAMRRMVSEFFFSIHTDLTAYSTDRRIDVVNDYIRALAGVIDFLESRSETTDKPPLPTPGAQWHSFSYFDSDTRGHGRPSALWNITKGEATKVTGHEVDFLCYQSPLRGDFELECDFPTEGGKHVSFMVAGTHVEVVDNKSLLRTGSFRRHTVDQTLEKPLTQFSPWARYRAVARDGLLTHYFNGEPVLEQELSPGHDPWIAIRSWRRSHGGVRDVRISGRPSIPNEVNLTGDGRLPGWAPYFETGFGPNGGAWRADTDDDGTIVISGMHKPEYSGSSLQKLLRYYRPLMEDGTLEYDFYYKAGHAGVHPALDRLALLLEPSGVQLHSITDRRYEFRDIDPGNTHGVSLNGPAAGSLPLKEDAWNRLALTLEGNAVQLSLNGQSVYEAMLGAANLRTFGLFHFSGQTSARVRNVVWRGDWPKSLPEISDQELASNELEFLDKSLPKLAQIRRFDFRKKLAPASFDFNGDQLLLEHSDKGVRQELLNQQGVSNIRACLQVEGDFDITARFEDLDIKMPIPRWDSAATLRFYFEGDEEFVCSLSRSTSRNASNRRINFAASWRDPGGKRRFSPHWAAEESRSGRFRVARRGKSLYGLYAAGDSPNFRLIGKHELTTAPVSIQGLRLRLLGAKDVDVGVTWKDLVIHAERLTSEPLEDDQPLVAKLNSVRDAASAETIEFSKYPVTASGAASLHVIESTEGTSRAVEDGLRMKQPADERQEMSILFSRFSEDSGIVNAVDVAASLDIHQFDVPERLGKHSEITMKLSMKPEPDSDRQTVREISFIMRQKANGLRDLIARTVERTSRGHRLYLPIRSIQVKSPDRLRFSIGEDRVYFLYSEADSDLDRVMAEAPLRGSTPGTTVELAAITNGKDRVTDVTWNKLTVHSTDEYRAD